MIKTAHALQSGLFAALIILPSGAQAVSESRARAAITAAEADLQASARAGALVDAADVQARAMAALNRARRHLVKGDERRAFYAAREADALADLAAATADYRRQTGSN